MCKHFPEQLLDLTSQVYFLHENKVHFQFLPPIYDLYLSTDLSMLVLCRFDDTPMCVITLVQQLGIRIDPTAHADHERYLVCSDTLVHAYVCHCKQVTAMSDSIEQGGETSTAYGIALHLRHAKYTNWYTNYNACTVLISRTWARVQIERGTAATLLLCHA